MNRVAVSRRNHLGVLRDRPRLDSWVEPLQTPVRRRRVDELRELLSLVDRGLLSEGELEAELQTIYGASSRNRVVWRG